jgi:uncharacterized delta-60 repeat protein
VTTDFDGGASGVILQPDGKIVAAGFAVAIRDIDFALVRYLQDGTLDTTFSGDGLVATDVGDPQRSFPRDFALGLALQPDGRLVLAGTSLTDVPGFADFDFALARYESGLVLGRGPPTNKEECKHGGWRTFNTPRDFKNQGDCIQFVNTGH